MARDPVLSYVGDAQAAQRATGIPADVLLGLVSIESGGREGLTSSAGAQGLTQFIAGTARAYNVDVRPGHARSQIMGAARYLVDLGFKDDPELALKKYNAGPGNPSAAGDYGKKVLAAARRYRGAGSAPSPASGGGRRPVSGSVGAVGTAGAGQGLIGEQERSGALRALTWTALAASGVVVIALGVGQSLGLRKTFRGALGATT
jgi:hypothetical protein